MPLTVFVSTWTIPGFETQKGWYNSVLKPLRINPNFAPTPEAFAVGDK